MFSASVGITMGMIHGGNSTSYWFVSCLHLGNMWPHNMALSGPSLSDWTHLSLKHSRTQQEAEEERQRRREKPLHLLLLIFSLLHTLVNKWWDVRRGFFFPQWAPATVGTSPDYTWEGGGPLLPVSAGGTSTVLLLTHAWYKRASRKTRAPNLSLSNA